ncbi:MAG TPA: TetR/AcrR family transcriptional regulator [Nonomuraea sp.]|nr:TetR/AcrR family transcriptional regulator [Nonomuraea sp.]
MSKPRREKDVAPPVRTRRRGALLEDALLDAAWEEVRAAGYANLTMEGVAARAGTSKGVLYRRWPYRAMLILSAIRRQMPSMRREIPDTGDLREDVLIVMREFRRRYEIIGPDIAHGLMSELSDMPGDAWDVSPEVLTIVLERAATRGEVRMEGISPRVVTLPLDLLRHALMLSPAQLGAESLAEIVDEIFLPLVRLSTAAERS